MKNWRTTLIGLLTAIANVVLPMLATGGVQGKDVAVSVGIAALGYLSKDFAASGTVTQ